MATIHQNDIGDAQADVVPTSTAEIPMHVARVVEQITDGFVMLDIDDRYVYVNGHGERILNKSRKELLGQVMWQVFPDSIGSGFYNKFQAAREAGEQIVSRDFVRSHGARRSRAFRTSRGSG